MLKVGERQIYTLDWQTQKQKPHLALCVLDFYVCNEHQRKGLGLQLFEYMLSIERMHPNELAYDRPSFRLLGFLAKHYQLDKPQTFYRFVVFPSEKRSIGKSNDKTACSMIAHKGKLQRAM